ncbi:acyltransferase family protein [Aspergillus brunneoviolaceus CBS 621.78]|uniref:Acyltransferase n=1 Tax=Aspergillus brunneoviolaceus CBS 621.78 TaxID=1450534 RepID=A0ACD1GQS3_9EURO|nr:acyltransferase [Aspergillus brunneoviolaceus CBS 621.78]RAH51406.1 acyltransferase [Aspergillus brunneoviolaceus CBS 621.78]
MSLIDKGLASPLPVHDVPLHDLESSSRAADHRYSSMSSSFSSSNYNDSLQEYLGQFTDMAEAFCTKVAIIVTPSYLQQYVGGTPRPATKPHAIAALDGLRGWACLLVFNFHFLFTYTWKVALGWGFNGENFALWQLPILHMLVSGHIMVAIFFVISGYVLSYKPLKLIRSRAWEQTFTTLASATFRRALRLYIPSFVGITLVFLAVRLGAFHPSRRVLVEGHTILGTNEQHPPIMRSFTKQFWDGYSTLAQLMDPFNWSLYYNNYNPHLWTIPVEFRSSIVLFLTILGTSRLGTPVRISLVSGLIWFCMRFGRWDVVLFLSGMLLAEADLIHGTWEQGPIPAGTSSSTTTTATIDDDPKPQLRRFLPAKSRSYHYPVLSRLSTRRIPYRNIWFALFIIGLYLGSTPNTGYKWTPFYMWTWKITPKTYPEPHRFPQTIGAILIVASINHSPEIQRLFTNRLSQYLGQISFAFYIVHGPILHGLGYAIMPRLWAITGRATNFQAGVAYLLGWMICLPIALWAGDLFWRAVDIPSVRFARWVEEKVIVKGPVTVSRPAPGSSGERRD